MASGGSAGGNFILMAVAGWRGSVEISKERKSQKYVVVVLSIAKKCTTAINVFRSVLCNFFHMVHFVLQLCHFFCS